MNPDLFGHIAPAFVPATRARAQRCTQIRSRAVDLGVSPKTMVARTNRTLKSVREQIVPLANQWIDIDNSVQGALDEFLAAYDAFVKHIAESAEWLAEETGS